MSVDGTSPWTDQGTDPFALAWQGKELEARTLFLAWGRALNTKFQSKNGSYSSNSVSIRVFNLGLGLGEENGITRNGGALGMSLARRL